MCIEGTKGLWDVGAGKGQIQTNQSKQESQSNKEQARIRNPISGNVQENNTKTQKHGWGLECLTHKAFRQTGTDWGKTKT